MKTVNKKKILISAGILLAVVSIFMSQLNWVTLADLSAGNGGGFTIFRLYGVIRLAAASPEIGSTATLSARFPLLVILACVSTLCLIAFVVLLVLRKKKATLTGFLGFIGMAILSVIGMDTMYNANVDSAFAGPGLFANNFIRITPPTYFLLFAAIFACAVVMPAVADLVSGRMDAKAEEKRALAGKLADTSIPRGIRFRLWLKVTLTAIVRDKYLYLMLLPFLAYYVIFYYLPFRGLEMAFLDYKPLLGYVGSKWIGLKTFIGFFTGPYFWRILRNTVLLNLYSLLWGFPIPIILAILFNELRSKKFRTLSQTISYIPNFISVVVIIGMAINFMSPSSGVINFILRAFGVDPIYFIAKSAYFRTIYVVICIWAWSGFNSIVFYSSICSIDGELYEAAMIDGAGRLKQILKITLPGIMPTIAIMLIMSIGGLLNSSTDMVFLLYRPATYEVSDIIGTYVYRLGLASNSPDYSLSTVVGLFNGIVALVLVVTANKISKRVSETSIF